MSFILVNASFSNAIFTTKNFTRYGRTQRFYYDLVSVTVTANGVYTIISVSKFDIYGYLYQDHFDSFNSSRNLIAFNDDGGGNLQFKISPNLLTTKLYYLVVTTYSAGVIGSYQILITGPGQLTTMLV